MALVLNEEQRLLQDTARDFLASNAPVEALRKLRVRGVVAAGIKNDYIQAIACQTHFF